MSRNIAIIFTDKWLAYSPTTLGIYDALKQKGCNVRIFAGTQAEEFRRNIGRDIEIVHDNHDRFLGFRNLADRIKRRITRPFRNGKQSPQSDYGHFVLFDNALRRFNPDEIIAVDSRALVIAQHSFPQKKINLLSLEIREADPYRAMVSIDRISRVIIQSEVRLKHLINGAKIKPFFVQNSPTFEPFDLNTTDRKGLVFCGTATEGFGILSCARFLSDCTEYQLTVKGAVLEPVMQYVQVIFPELLRERRLVIDTDYLEMPQLLPYLRKFRIGFCFYDTRFPFYDCFNYQTAPSGKMFAYFASGVPVIGTRLPGLKPIEDFNAGVLIENLEVSTIKRAIATIEADYHAYAHNCLKAAERFSFDRSIAPFVDDLMASLET